MAAAKAGRNFGGDLTNTRRQQDDKLSIAIRTPCKKNLGKMFAEASQPTPKSASRPKAQTQTRALSAESPKCVRTVTPTRPASAPRPRTPSTRATPSATAARATRSPAERSTSSAASSTGSRCTITRSTTPRSTTPRSTTPTSSRNASPARGGSSTGPAKQERIQEANKLHEVEKQNEALLEKVRQLMLRKEEKENKEKASSQRETERKQQLQEASDAHALHVSEFEEHEADLRGQIAANTTRFESESTKDANLTAGLEAKQQSIEKTISKTDEVHATKVAMVEKFKDKIQQADAMRAACRKEEAKLEEQKAMLGEMVVHNRKLHNAYHDLKGNIRVFCRLRPQLTNEIGDPLKVELQGDDQLTVQSAPQKNVTGESMRCNAWDFAFDQVFAPSSSQATIFEEIGLLVQSALDGYRVAIFAYGQTGSGKTYTMEGPQGEDYNKEDAGIIPRTVDLIFSEMNQMKHRGWTFQVHITMIEVYNEAIYDLLAQKSGQSNASTPREREGSSQRGASTPRERSVPRERSLPRDGSSSGDAFSHEAFSDQYRHVRVESAAAVHHFLNHAAGERHVAATACNDRSSRSHAVFQLALSGRCDTPGDGLREVEGLLSLVDLAGSERVEKSQATGERLKEAQHINRSLSALGDVIEALGRRGPNGGGHVPYRNSKLTMLLKESLGGESKALMFVNVSMCAEHLGETLSSLRFAHKVHSCNVGIAKRTAG